MKFSYRGVDYENAHSTLEVTEGEIGGKYRGQSWRFQYLRHIPEPLPVQNLKYRGVSYRTNQAEASKPRVVTQPISDVPFRTLPTLYKHEVRDELTRNHLKNICRSLEHRMEVAKTNGDQNLIRLLEAESINMACPLH